MPFTPKAQSRPPLHKYERIAPAQAPQQLRLRKIASRQIEDHFQKRHVRYKSKENVHSSCFKARARGG
jgi:hypothetical protein